MIPDPAHAQEQDKAAIAAAQRVHNLVLQAFDHAWNLGTRYHDKELAQLRRVKAELGNPHSSDAQFRAFVRDLLSH